MDTLTAAIAQNVVPFKTTLLVAAVPVTISVAVALNRVRGRRASLIRFGVLGASVGTSLMTIMHGAFVLLLSGGIGIVVGAVLGGLIGLAWRIDNA
jgi:hypothetical protein